MDSKDNDKLFAKVLGSIRNMLSLKKESNNIELDVEEFNDQNMLKQNYIDSINTLYAENNKTSGNKSGKSNTFEDLIDEKVKSLTTNPDLARLARYQELDFMVTNLPQVSRALQIYTDNIVSPNDITKQSLSINVSDNLDTAQTDVVKGMIRKIISTSKLESMIDSIVYDTLSKGDKFVEIVNLTELKIDKLLEFQNVKVDESKEKDVVHQLTEVKVRCLFDNMENDSEVEKVLNEKTDTNDLELDSLLEDNNDIVTKNPESVKPQDKKQEEKKKQETNINTLSKLSYKYHKPENVIKVSKDSFIFGYIVFSGVVTKQTDITKTNQQTSAKMYGNSTTVNVGEEIIGKVFETIKTAIKNKNKELETNESEMYSIIRKLLYDANANITCRFVKPEYFVHFKIPGKFEDYGEGIFYNVRSTARMYTIMLYAVTIHRLTRSMEKRVFNVDIGDSIDAAGLIQQFKKSIKQKSVVFSDDITLDNIPDMISMFEDYYIPQRDGTPFVNIDTLPGQEIQGKLDELEFLRKQMLVGIGVPPTLLGYDQDASYTTTLSQENSMFAQTIIRYQKNFSTGFTELIEKIYAIVNTSNIDMVSNATVTLQPPKILQIQREAEVLGNLQNIKDVLETLGVPKEYISKKYFSNYIDHVEVEKMKQKETVSKELNPVEPEVTV